MPSYRQYWKYHEDGYGEVLTVLMVSDTRTGLFTATPDADTDLLVVESSSKDFEIKEGMQAEDQLRIVMNETFIQNTTDGTIRDFILDAQDDGDNTKRRFIAWFIQPVDISTLTIDDAEIIGVIAPKMDWEDVEWTDAEWGDNPDPPRIWKLTAAPFVADTFDKVEMKDLIYGKGTIGNPDYVPGIDATWESTNVADRIAYFSGSVDPQPGILRETMWRKLVKLDEVIKKLASNLNDALSARGMGTFTFYYDQCVLDFKLSPARYKHFLYGASKRSRYNCSWSQAYGGVFTIEPGDADSYNLFNAGSDYQCLWINYYMVKPDIDTEPPGGSAADWGIEKTKTFTGLLYATAASFGLFPKIIFEDPSTVRISFESRSNIKKHRIWIIDAENPTGNTEPIPATEFKAYTGASNWLAKDGVDGYKDWWDKGHEPSKSMSSRRSVNDILWTVATTVKFIDEAREGDLFVSVGLCMPHNVVFYNDGVVIADRIGRRDGRGLSTALHLKVVGLTEYGLVGQPMWSTAARVHAKIDSIDRSFDSLTDYLNAISERDKQYFKSEYKFTIPYLCRFRKSADGSHADDDGGRGRWQNLQLGCTWQADGKEWIVIGIERQAGDTPQTTLRLHLSEQYAFSAASGAVSQITPTETADSFWSASNNVAKVIYGETIKSGDVLAIFSNGKVYRAEANSDFYGKLFAIANEDGLIDEEHLVVRPGSLVENNAYSFTDAGMIVYAKGTALGTPNLSTTPPDGAVGNNMHAPIGTTETATSFLFNIDMQFMIE